MKQDYPTLLRGDNLPDPQPRVVLEMPEEQHVVEEPDVAALEELMSLVDLVWLQDSMQERGCVHFSGCGVCRAVQLLIVLLVCYPFVQVDDGEMSDARDEMLDHLMVEAAEHLAGPRPAADHHENEVVEAALADDAWNVYLLDVVRSELWGFFTWSRKQVSRANANGMLELSCPYHAKSRVTGCKKAVSIPARTEQSVQQVVWALKAWANRASSVGRQRQHMIPYRLDLHATPPRETVLANQITAAPGAIRTDEELDEIERRAVVGEIRAKAQAKGKAKARGKAKGQAQAKRAPAAVVPAPAPPCPEEASSLSSTSSSTSSDSSSSE